MFDLIQDAISRRLSLIGGMDGRSNNRGLLVLASWSMNTIGLFLAC